MVHIMLLLMILVRMHSQKLETHSNNVGKGGTNDGR